MVLMVQKEVAQRICAKPPKMNLLAVSVQFYANPKIISFVPKDCFWPKPKVDSAILKISNLKTQNLKLKKLFFKIVKAGFSHPRKQLINNLSKGLKIEKEKIKKWLLENKIKPEKRAESLSIEDWLNLVKNFKKLDNIFYKK
jgi:16S rRNA (adenine1518-N6/adenine1519-N6)-dimethyltransferase